MKYSTAFLLLFFSISTIAQDSSKAFDPEHYKPTYSLSLDGWQIERFPIPIEFAPKIPYHGVEDIRFTVGWGDVKSEDYWSYAYLWSLDGHPAITEKTIESNLTLYYDGLVGRNIAPRKIPADKLIPTKVMIRKTSKQGNDLQTFSGTIQMLDYMQQQPMTLNCVIHVRSCAGQDRTFVFNEISPQAPDGKVWKRFKELWAGFGCEGKSN